MKIAFMGSPDIAATCLRAVASRHEVVLVVSQPDKPAGRGGKLASPAAAVVATELGLPLIQPRSARTGELAAALAATGAELAAVVAYGKILPRTVLDAAPRGCINVHASLLPKYRGAAPVQWAVIHGERETGVSIMQLDDGMDTGPVYFERRVAIGDDETGGELLARLADVGAAALVDAIAAIASGAARATAQDHAAATLAPMLDKRDGAIDFGKPAREVAARVRGVDPWPGAHALLRGQVVKLFRARAVEAAHAAVPGTVLAIASDGAAIACGDGAAVRVAELQLPGKKRMPASVVANGRGIAIGDLLALPPAEQGAP
jgi:methionyl-tRNA formyltransferase|nr:methionyl-tRNA formyltransferase [Kofleriaceae bacterium]